MTRKTKGLEDPTLIQAAKTLLTEFKAKKIEIGQKYHNCDYFREGIEFKTMMAEAVGRVRALEDLLKVCQ